MAELFRRMAYNVLIQNTDDHLRNLGFLYAGSRKWSLSPAFDVNPVPEEGTRLKTAISEIHGNALDIDAVLDAAPLFDVDTDTAAATVSTMAATIKDEWQAIGAKIGMTAPDIKAIRPAMENSRIERALALKQTLVPGGSP